jgi:hypothetical protein
MKSVRKQQLDSALIDVQGEMEELGLWAEDSPLLQVEVFWCALPQVTPWGALGFFIHEANGLDRFLGYEAGHMYIPKWVLIQGFWQNRGSLRDVLRHEYGHAVAHYFPALIQRSSEFRFTFGGKYFGQQEHVWREADYVSDYAQENPTEDFAETFMFYLRNGGARPRRFDSRVLRRKWRFITDLCRVVASGGTSWPS